MKKNIYGIVKTELYYCWRTYSLTFEWFCPQTAPLWGPLQRAWSSLSSGGGAAWTRCCILWGYMADLPCLLRLSGGEGICAVCQQNKGLTGERTEVLVETKNTKRYIEYSKLLVKLYSCLTQVTLFQKGQTNLRCFLCIGTNLYKMWKIDIKFTTL